MNKVKIYGGLGNQMFQYALCLALNQKGNKTRIMFSIFFYDTHHNGFNLSKAFKIKLPFPLNLLNLLLQIGETLYKNKIPAYILRKIIQKYNNMRYTIVYKEKREFEYDGNIFNQKNSLIIGIWQVEEYFKDINDLVQQEFIFKTPKDNINEELIEKIINCNSVSIHIRRGDYLNNTWEKTHGVIKGTSYYTSALDYISKNVQRPEYFVFSDDIQWVMENLKIQNCIYIDHNKGKKSYIDMYLMSLCKHNIIANSTFSWWAAWLNKNKTKIVIMPDRWINGENCDSIFPSKWIKLKVD